MKNNQYEKRSYRDWVNSPDLITFEVTEFETDLYISATKNLYNEAFKSVKFYRNQLNEYIKNNIDFQTSFVPVDVDLKAAPIIIEMAKAAQKANVGPFAAVAGAMAEFVGKDLLNYSPEIIVENGGDIFINTKRDRKLAIYAGKSPLSGKLGINISKYLSPVGVCTSSGTVGHSISFGKADAVVVISPSTILADAVATAAANLIHTKYDIEKSIDFAKNISGVIGVIAIIDTYIGVWGDFELLEL